MSANSAQFVSKWFIVSASLQLKQKGEGGVGYSLKKTKTTQKDTKKPTTATTTMKTGEVGNLHITSS